MQHACFFLPLLQSFYFVQEIFGKRCIAEDKLFISINFFIFGIPDDRHLQEVKSRTESGTEGKGGIESGRERGKAVLDENDQGEAGEEENAAMDVQLGEDEEHQWTQTETAHRFEHYQLKATIQ